MSAELLPLWLNYFILLFPPCTLAVSPEARAQQEGGDASRKAERLIGEGLPNEEGDMGNRVRSCYLK